MTRIIVTGGRDFDDVGVIHRVLDALHQEQPITVLAHGNARGVDRLAGEWAAGKMPRPTVHTFDADWAQQGKSAGVRRNRQMIAEMKRWGAVRLVVAFPGGRGTEDCVRQAKAAGLVVVRVVVAGTTTAIIRDDG